MKRLEVDLSNPRYTLLHRAGLAGLWMTLYQFEQEKFQPDNLHWQLYPHGLTLEWDGTDFNVLDGLFKQAFQIDDGMIQLRGLDPKQLPLGERLICHEGMVNTFVQHTSACKSASKQPKQKSFFEEEDKPETGVTISYKDVCWYVHQDFAKSLCNKQGELIDGFINVAGWLNPGAAVRHVAFAVQTSFEELAVDALVLAFAPVACCYFRLRSHLRHERSQYALVIPEIKDLEDYAKYRRSSYRVQAFRDLYATGTADAGLRFLVADQTTETLEKYHLKPSKCQVVTLGTVTWSKQQKTRTDLSIINPDPETQETYHFARQLLIDRELEGEYGFFVISSLARELITENLAKSRRWYAGISSTINSNALFEQLSFERGGLNEMIHSVRQWSDTEKRFVIACHEALSRIYGQVKDDVLNQAQRDKASSEFTNKLLRTRFNQKATRIRAEINRCKNAATFRRFITKFWSNAGQLPTLHEHWSELMELAIGHKTWSLARDLALLALASYKGKGVSADDITTEETEAEVDDSVELQAPTDEELKHGF
jgi:CRISPR-associated protein Cas8a1/Csx13